MADLGCVEADGGRNEGPVLHACVVDFARGRAAEEDGVWISGTQLLQQPCVLNRRPVRECQHEACVAQGANGTAPTGIYRPGRLLDTHAGLLLSLRVGKPGVIKRAFWPQRAKAYARRMPSPKQKAPALGRLELSPGCV